MFKLSDSAVKYIKNELVRYESKQSAIIRSLYKAQEENGGYLSNEVIGALSTVMEIPASQIEEVATFYTMFNKKPVGKYHVQVCCTLSCAMAGGRELTDVMMKEAGCKQQGDVSPDGLFTFSKVECLGSCDTAPMLQVNRDPYIEGLDQAQGIELVKKLKAQGAPKQIKTVEL